MNFVDDQFIVPDGECELAGGTNLSGVSTTHILKLENNSLFPFHYCIIRDGKSNGLAGGIAGRKSECLSGVG